MRVVARLVGEVREKRESRMGRLAHLQSVIEHDAQGPFVAVEGQHAVRLVSVRQQVLHHGVGLRVRLPGGRQPGQHLYRAAGVEGGDNEQEQSAEDANKRAFAPLDTNPTCSPW